MSNYANLALMGNSRMQASWVRLLPGVTFFAYVLLSVYAMLHHEPWGDEIHSWNIAKGSASYLDVIQNSRYEGHPPTWYTIMWIVSKFTHHFSWVQAVHLSIATLTVFLILFYSPLPLVSRLLIPFGYYFAFEFSILARNYAIGVLAAFCICLIMRRSFRYKMICYYGLLLVLANGHLFGLILAGSLHLYYLVWDYEQHKNVRRIITHLLAGAVFLLPSCYFMFPPSTGALNVNFWMDRWNASNVMITVQSPLRSITPVPAWWNEHFWNTQFLMEWQHQYRWMKYFTPLLSAGIVAAIFFILRKSRKSNLLFFSNLLVTGFISVLIFPLGCARYAGLIYIGFLAAWWLYCYEAKPVRWHKWVVNSLLVIQMTAAAVAIGADSGRPFSNFNRVGELVGKVPANEKIVVDYWGANATAAFMDKPFYCLDLKKEVFFLLWDSDMAKLMKSNYRYTEGAEYLATQGVDKFWMISTGSPDNLAEVDTRFATAWQVNLMDKIEGAIEKGGNLYLYKMSKH
ncbi:MAG: hypothetical protein J7621_20590 [Niastella sp.]|nr:hypothetical protein [Niastella sp.]